MKSAISSQSTRDQESNRRKSGVHEWQYELTDLALFLRHCVQVTSRSFGDARRRKRIKSLTRRQRRGFLHVGRLRELSRPALCAKQAYEIANASSQSNKRRKEEPER